MSMGSPEGVLWEVLRMLQGPREPEPQLSAERGVGPFSAVSAGALFSRSGHCPVKVQGRKRTEELTRRPRPRCVSLVLKRCAGTAQGEPDGREPASSSVCSRQLLLENDFFYDSQSDLC